ncbi:restriction endonuclease subunit S [Azospirillum brasilense]|uniref:restriction endonuclease subunit S n=1 Tax=Azospirillum brasilense TaxID=192 RepID=UPI001B3B79FB|nr:restriction endonuclease subunit S [Azospirillum brasilense]
MLCDINPKGDSIDPLTPVSFVPMPAVSDEQGIILEHGVRPFGEVAKGYTRFQDGDVIFAKITPCMENGKIAVARGLHNGLACGSTEFHVLRPRENVVLADYLWRFLRRQSFRDEAQHHMSGAVGQQRVPVEFLKKTLVPLPPFEEQRRIVAKLDVLFERLQSASADLAAMPKLIKQYRQAVLDAAFRGELTSAWRIANIDTAPAQEFYEERQGWAVKRTRQSGLGRDEKSAILTRDPALERTLAEVAAGRSLPSTWLWCGLGEVFGTYVGATPSRKEPAYWGGEIAWVSSGEVAFCRISNTKEKITSDGLANASTRMHPAGTVLLGMIGEGKTRGQAAILDTEACNNQNCAAIRVSEGDYPPEYVYWYLYAVYERTRSAGAGNNQPALNKEKVQRLPLPLAPPVEASAVVRALEARLAPMQRIEDELASSRKHADRLGEQLLGRAFRGELVAQDPNDEPADELLKRILSVQAEPADARRGRPRRAVAQEA